MPDDYDRFWRFALATIVACVLAVILIYIVTMALEHRQDNDIVTVDFEEQAKSKEIALPAEPVPPAGANMMQPLDSLLDAGRKVYYGEYTNYPDAEEAYRYYATYKTVTFVTLRGFPNSPFADWDYAGHFVNYCRDSGREFEMALAIAELESTYGASYNTWGILDKRFNGHYIEGYCAYLDWHQTNSFGATSNALGAIFQVYNDHQEWRDNVTELYEGIKGERY